MSNVHCDTVYETVHAMASTVCHGTIDIFLILKTDG